MGREEFWLEFLGKFRGREPGVAEGTWAPHFLIRGGEPPQKSEVVNGSK